jgi:hypothetical protein
LKHKVITHENDEELNYLLEKIIKNLRVIYNESGLVALYRFPYLSHLATELQRQYGYRSLSCSRAQFGVPYTSLSPTSTPDFCSKGTTLKQRHLYLLLRAYDLVRKNCCTISGDYIFRVSRTIFKITKIIGYFRLR